MWIVDKIREIRTSLQPVGGIPLPLNGRSSDETLGGAIGTALKNYSTVSPIVNFDALQLLKTFAIFNPDVSQFCTNIINLANTGHNIQIDAKSPAVAEAALKRLNETATRLFRNGAGVDGLMNAYAFQIAWSGALSSEDVVNLDARRVEQTVLVPVEQIRFKYNDALGCYEPYQRPAHALHRVAQRTPFGLIPLHPTTYRYYALQTIENSPYGKPPGSAAIEVICETQKPIMSNIQHIAQKYGLLGLFTAAVTPPKRLSNQSESEYLKYCSEYLGQVAKALVQYIRDGLVVNYRDQKIEHTNIAEGAQGVYDLNRISEEQVMSGLSMQPAFFGRTDSTTETYADVVYSLLLAQVHNIQRLIKRRQEQTYRLDLRLGGLEVDGVSIKFNKTFSRNTLQENQAEQIKWQMVLEKVKNGVITPDMGAQELGYDTWADTQLIEDMPPSIQNLMRSMQKVTVETFSFRFDLGAQKYKFVQPTIELSSADENPNDNSNVVDFEKKKAQRA